MKHVMFERCRQLALIPFDIETFEVLVYAPSGIARRTHGLATMVLFAKRVDVSSDLCK